MTPRQEALYLLRKIFGVEKVSFLEGAAFYQVELSAREGEEITPYCTALRAFAKHLSVSDDKIYCDAMDDMVELGIDSAVFETPETLQRLRDFSPLDMPAQERKVLFTRVKYRKTDELNRPRTLSEMQNLLDLLNEKMPWRYDDNSHEFVTLHPVQNARNFRIGLGVCLNLGVDELSNAPFDEEGRASMPVKVVAVHYDQIMGLLGNQRLIKSIREQLTPANAGIGGVGAA